MIFIPRISRCPSLSSSFCRESVVAQTKKLAVHPGKYCTTGLCEFGPPSINRAEPDIYTDVLAFSP